MAEEDQKMRTWGTWGQVGKQHFFGRFFAFFQVREPISAVHLLAVVDVQWNS